MSPGRHSQPRQAAHGYSASSLSTPSSPLADSFVARPPRIDSRLHPSTHDGMASESITAGAAAPPSPSTSNMASALRRSAARRETVQFFGDKHALSSFASGADRTSSTRPRSNSAADSSALLDAFVPVSAREARTRSPTPSSAYESAQESTPRQTQTLRDPAMLASSNEPAASVQNPDKQSPQLVSLAAHPKSSDRTKLSPPTSPVSDSARDGDESSDSQDWKGLEGDFASSPLKSPLLSLLAGEQDHMQSIAAATQNDSPTEAVSDTTQTQEARKADQSQTLKSAAAAEGPWWKTSAETSPILPQELRKRENARKFAGEATKNDNNGLVPETSPSQVGKALDWDDSQPSRPSTPQPSAYVPSRPSLGTPPLSRRSSRQSSPARSLANSPSTGQDYANTTSSPLAVSLSSSQAHESTQVCSLADSLESAGPDSQFARPTIVDHPSRDRSGSDGPTTASSGPTRRPARRELPMPPPEKSSKRTSIMKLRKQQQEQQQQEQRQVVREEGIEPSTAVSASPRAATAQQRRPSLAGPATSPSSQQLAEATPRSIQDPQRLSLYSFADSDSRHGLTQPNTPLSATDFVETYGGTEFGRTSSFDGSIAASRPSSYYLRGSLSNEIAGPAHDVDSLSNRSMRDVSMSEQLSGKDADLSSAMLSFGISEQDEQLSPAPVTSRAQTPASHQDSLYNRQSSEMSDDVFHDAPMARVASSDPTHPAPLSENSRATTPLPLQAKPSSSAQAGERQDSPRADAKARAAAFVADLRRAASTPNSTAQLSTGLPSDASSPSLYVAAPSPASSPVADLAANHDASTSRIESALPPPPAKPSPAPTQIAHTIPSPSAPVYASSALSTHARTSQTSLSPSPTAPPHSSVATPHGQADYLGSIAVAQQQNLMPRYRRLHRRRALPPALQIAPDLRRCHSAGARAAVYLGKITSLRQDASGLQDWVSFVRGDAAAAAGFGQHSHLQQLSPFDRSRRAREDSSSSTFPSRGEGHRAREIYPDVAPSPRDSISPLPYPGVSGKFASKTTAGKALFGLGRKASKRATASISGPMYGANAGGTSGGVAGQTSASGVTRPVIGPPTNLTTSASLGTLTSIQSSNNSHGNSVHSVSNAVRSAAGGGGGGVGMSGPRMPRQSLDSSHSFLTSTNSSTTLAGSNNHNMVKPNNSSHDDQVGANGGGGGGGGGLHKTQMPPVDRYIEPTSNLTSNANGTFDSKTVLDDEKMDRLWNILPTASRQGLINALTKAGGDEVLAVSVYLSDESTARR
ncbi:hypothetical protein OIV83_006111 [Microbotryomycetes sp. JL201]|nr:hypothetical protein OIV83_006111 [Microbotryomycetes sp. JL201]